MSVVGYWTEDEIKASYSLSNGAVISCITVLTFAVIGIILWGRTRRKELLLACAVAFVSGTAYVFFAQELARSLCVDAPLYVKIHGPVKLPFFLATKDFGILVVIGLFAVANWLNFRCAPMRVQRLIMIFAVNLGLAGILATSTLIAYLGASLGVGVPTT